MTPDPFAPDQVGRAIPTAELEALKRCPTRSLLPRPSQGEQYLGGPIPVTWLERAARLPGKAFQLGVALWFAAGRSRGKNPAVVLSAGLMRRFGLSARTTRTRAIGALASAGLVAVEHRVGRPSVVTILPVDGARLADD